MNSIEATKDKIKVMQAFVDGQTLEVLSDWLSDDYIETSTPTWNWDEDRYRIKPELADSTPLNIPWDWIDKAYNYAAMDEDENVFFYNKQPDRQEDYWSASESVCDELDSSLLSGNKIREGVNWKTSLTERPKK